MAWLAVALGGAVGAMTRYGIAMAAARWSFPWGTLITNAIGCLLLGILAEYALRPNAIDPVSQKLLGVGFLGALTTFSTFSHDTIRLLEAGRSSAAMGNMALNLGIGLAAVWVGIQVVRR